MSARKLTDAIAKARGKQITDEPVVVKVAAVDNTETLAEEAKRGVTAIEALAVERKEAVSLAANLNLKLNVIQANNVDLREREAFWRDRCHHLMQINARLQAHISNARGLWQNMAQDLHRGNMEIAQMQPLTPPDNNPDLPPVDVMGLPIELTADEEAKEPDFDTNGVPTVKAHSVGNEHIKEMIARLDALQ